MNTSIQSRPRDGKTHFRSDVHAKILRFFDKVFMIRVAMGDVFWRHQFFETMLILTVLGLRNIIFEEKGFFGTYVQKYVPKKSFSGHIFLEKIVSGKMGLGSPFLAGGQARKITPVIYPLIFKNFFGHETGRRGSCGAVQHLVFLEISSRGPF